MSNHPILDYYVFQIDGNYGAISGICEMLLQSDEDRTMFYYAPKRYGGHYEDLPFNLKGLFDVEFEAGKMIKSSQIV